MLAGIAGSAPFPHQLNVRQMITRRGLVRLVGALAFGFAAGLTLGYSFRSAGGFAGGLLYGLVVGLTLGLTDRSPQSITPGEVIRADGRYGLVFGMALGIVAGLALGLGVGLTVGPVGGFALGLDHPQIRGLRLACIGIATRKDRVQAKIVCRAVIR